MSLYRITEAPVDHHVFLINEYIHSALLLHIYVA